MYSRGCVYNLTVSLTVQIYGYFHIRQGFSFNLFGRFNVDIWMIILCIDIYLGIDGFYR